MSNETEICDDFAFKAALLLIIELFRSLHLLFSTMQDEQFKIQKSVILHPTISKIDRLIDV